MAEAAVRKSIVSPWLDFLLLGGATLVLFPLAMVLLPNDMIRAYKLLPFFYGLAAFLEYVSNVPHFAHSYQLMYHGFRDKVTGRLDKPLQARYIMAGLIVPAVMLVFFTFCYLRHDPVLLSGTVNVLFFTVGWHYAKQGFGVLIVVSVYQRVFYAGWERRILLANAHLSWVYAWVMFNAVTKTRVFYGITFHTLGLPAAVETAFFAAVCLTTAASVFILLSKFRQGSGWPLINGIGAYIASIYAWVIVRFGPGYDTPIHPVVVLVPFLHAVQYMTIVYKMKGNQLKDKKISRRNLVFFLLGGFIVGALVMRVMPRVMDSTIAYDNMMYGTTLFFFLSWIFVNIHHYFIDNVIWRKENSDAKKYLYDAH